MKIHEIHRAGGGEGYGKEVAAPEPQLETAEIGQPEIGRPEMPQAEIRWLNTGAAAKRLGVTVRTLYRLIDEAQLPAYKFGRVIRLQQAEVDEFIRRSRIPAGSLEHLYPESRKETSDTDLSIT